MQKFYHAIIGELYSEQEVAHYSFPMEVNIAREILRSAEDQGLLSVGGASALLEGAETVGYILESIAPVMFDLNLRAPGLENGFEGVVCAILQMQQGIQAANKQSVYLAFLGLALKLHPSGGGGGRSRQV